MTNEVPRLTRRDFLKVATTAGAMLPLLYFTDGGNPPNNREAPITIEWIPTQDPTIDTYFRLADRPLQRWENQYMTYGDNVVYGLSLSASIGTSPLDPDILAYSTMYPAAEMYKQSAFVEKAGIIERSDGRIIESWVDPRVVSDALTKFSHTSFVDFFLYRVAVVPRKVVAELKGGRYLEYGKMPPDVEQFMFSGPLVPPGTDTTKHLIAYHTDSDLRQIFSDVIRVTGREGEFAYYMANVNYRNQET
jgi:hypothetical protein